MPYIAFAILTFVLYGNTINHFFAYDDAMFITQNRFTQQGVKGIPGIFSYDTFMGNWLIANNVSTADQLKKDMNFVTGGRYRPLSLLTFAIEVELFGRESVYPNSEIRFRGNAFVSHSVNILLYWLTVCVLYLVLSRLFPAEKKKNIYLSFPFLSTVLFLCHPIHTEVVANIKGRDEILCLLGSLGALWFTVRYMDTRSCRNLVLSGVCLFMGLLSKENAITFLSVVPVTVYYFVDRQKKMLLKSMIPLLTASALYLIIRTRITGFEEPAVSVPNILNNPFAYATAGERIATIFVTLWIYIKLLFFPYPLTYDYYPHHIEIANWSNPVALVSLVIYLGIGIYAIYGMIQKRDVVSWSIWLYLLPLSIVSNLFFPIGAFMGERFIFMSSIGFAVFAGWLIAGCVSGTNSLLPLFKKRISIAALVLTIIMLSLYSMQTVNRNRVWKDNFTLYTTDVKTSTNSAKGNFMAGFEYLRKAIFPNSQEEAQRRNMYCEEAAQLLTRAIALNPQYTDAIEQLGALYFDCYTDVAKSLHYFTMSLKQRPTGNHTTLHSIKQILNITPKLLEENRVRSKPEEIIASCDELLKEQPDIGEAYHVKGVIYQMLGDIHNANLFLSKANEFYLK